MVRIKIPVSEVKVNNIVAVGTRRYRVVGMVDDVGTGIDSVVLHLVPSSKTAKDMTAHKIRYYKNTTITRICGSFETPTGKVV